MLAFIVQKLIVSGLSLVVNSWLLLLPLSQGWQRKVYDLRSLSRL
ncbi:hypothetical protein [Fischerella thermalis]|nr:hypothetical protein [Fischerella thermalis]